nr:cell envelope integrity protein CreD [Kiritimatiellia bacterium]
MTTPADFSSAGSPPPIPPSPPSRNRPASGNSALVRLLIIGGLTVALMIPLMLVYGVLAERKIRQREAVGNITSSWGGDQMIVGPVLVVPYTYTVERQEKFVVNAVTGATEMRPIKETFNAQAFFLPEQMAISGALDTEQRRYGIYEAVLFRCALEVTGQFIPPNFEEWKVAAGDILWKEAVLAFHVSDLRGAPEAMSVTWDGREYPLEPGSRLPGHEGGVFARLPLDGPPSANMAFQMKVTLNGSQNIRFTPAGRQTRVSLRSPWPDPKFEGAFLPTDRTVTAEGFEAVWNMSYYGRGLPQQWTSRNNAVDISDIHRSQFGVSLLAPVDHYRLVERSIKYGILFLVLVFTVFFLFEVRSRVRIHPVQYTLVGAALVLFFLLLLALSEVMTFGAAYAAGAGACTALITLYSARALRSIPRALVVTGE